MKVNTGPIGVFDSGVGGLTVLRELLRAFPGVDFFYFGDTARVPYGIRSPEVIRRFALEGCRFLEQEGARFIVVACNSASAAAITYLRDRLKVPVMGVIEPGVRSLLKKEKEGPVGIIGTRATVESGSYPEKIKSFAPHMEVIQQACPLFVPLAEEGLVDHLITYSTVEFYLKSLKDKIKALVLGCTHYPLLKKTISQFLGSSVLLIDSGEAVAEELHEFIEAGSGKNSRELRFYVTDDPRRFADLGCLFLGKKLSHVEKIPLGNLESLVASG